MLNKKKKILNRYYYEKLKLKHDRQELFILSRNNTMEISAMKYFKIH